MDSIRWTVLPDGVVEGDAVRLSVLVSPSLTGIDQLDGSAYFVNWPEKLARLLPALWLEFDSPQGTVVKQWQPTGRYPAADSTLWTTLFTPTTFVRRPQAPSTFAAAGRRTLRSYPGKLVHDEVTGVYEAVAVSTTRSRLSAEWAREERMLCEEPPTDHRGWELPSKYRMADIISSQVLELGRKVETGFAAVEEALEPHGDGPRSAAAPEHEPRFMDRTSDVYTDEEKRRMLPLAEAARFYERGKEPAGFAEEPPHRVDFHEACGLIGDYPELQRRFGLVVDLRFTMPSGVADGAKVRVLFDESLTGDAQLNTPGRRPWTKIRFVRGSVFEAAEETPGALTGRVLNLGDPESWHLTELDVDGAALKHLDYAASIDTLHDSDLPTGIGSVAQEVTGTGTPAARGSGITLLHTDRDRQLAGLIGADLRRRTSAADVDLTAENLVRGYRVDIGAVDPATGLVTQWRSLLRRRGRYVIRRPGQPPVEIQVRPDEGTVRASVVTTDGADDRQLYGHQAVFGWHGWSLAAPRPGRTIGLDDAPQEPKPPVSPDVPLDTKFTAEPGSLPALRYGRTYRMRARVVDLAGNGLDHTAGTPDAVQSDAITYGRWEPVPQPVVLPLLPFNEGESTERLVIRSTVTDDGREISTDEYVLRRSDVPDHEPHSDVDGLDRQYKAIAERHLAPPKTALQMAEEHGVFDAAFGAGKPDRLRKEYYTVASRESGSFLDTVVRDPEWPYREHDLLREDSIHIAKHDVHDPLPVTPLPLARRGAGLRQGEFVVHDSDQLILPYLPDVLAEGVMLRGLPGDRENRKIPFPGPWPQAKPFKLRILEGTGEPHWHDGLIERVLEVFLPKAEIAKVRLSCYLDAAKLPLLRQWNLLTGSRFWTDLPERDKTFVTRASADGENWMLTPWVELTLVHAVEKPVHPPELSDLGSVREAEQTAARLTGRLTSHAESSGHVELDAHWSEWLDDVTQTAPSRIDGHTHLEDITLEYTDDVEQVRRTHEFGDTRHRNVRYTPTAVTRFREYFHPSITQDRNKVIRVGPTNAALPVPSSRRPEPPVVAYIVPTFRRERTVDHQRLTVTQRRASAGLRVYLNRPWFSSGDDEMLAVVLDPGTGLKDHLATRWGIDPVWSGTPPLPRPTAAHFPNAERRPTGLRLAESPDSAPVLVDAVAFTPKFHKERQLWYVDIDVDFGAGAGAAAYFPYLRLALARYQPYSVDPLHLSKVELAEFAQVVPPRTLTGHREGERLDIKLTGPATVNELGEISGTGTAAAAASRRVVVTLQSRASLGEDDMDWKQATAPVDLACRAEGGGFVWSGGPAATGGQLLTLYRLLVQEYELYRTDKDTATDTVTVNGRPVSAARRLVHADYFGLTVGLLGRLDFEL
ncbi:hypothetical protein [Streptomyces flavofungini]|uniref:Uncharacterized protein n=1 Tax=Streptomyces flavofungini TaxID=68200 RepID=A0ABS0X7L6_9ACTN|nr:hypothetical protein [Streptomyces flavofungini]MBJ3808969.1 hypothetical protein [Streptomyces flavofungini]GHC67907.1 hypothetical protein GCM10010349_41340 [Streptomyces flavofungini]